jgi:uncharacterized protein (TIGR03435 family)
MRFCLRIVRAALIALLGSTCHAPLFAQAADSLAFQVASVRVNKSNNPTSSRFPLGPGDAYAPGSLFSATNQPLIGYLRFAYKLGQGDLLGLPAWVYSDTFDIEARASGNPTKDQMRAMMQSLLTDRFKLSTHKERQKKPVFNLVLAKARKTGPKLQPDPGEGVCSLTAFRADLSSIPCGSVGPVSASTPEKGRLVGRSVTIAQIAAILANPFTGVDRPVMDRTGLIGTFDFSVEWSLARDRAQPPDASQKPGLQTDDDGPTFREALQKQLGLKLVSATGLVDVLVIDRVEHPEEN